MSNSNYKQLRVPVIPLDYNARYMAEKKEILFDYSTGKLYVVSATDKSIIFDITQQIMREVQNGVDLTNYTFNVEGVGNVNLSEYIKQIQKFNIKLVNESSVSTYSPKVRYDNQSIVNFDGVIEVAGFSAAKDDTYAVKDGTMIKWIPRSDTGLLERVRILEETAPPNPEKFAKLQEDVKNIKLVADGYADVLILRRDVDANTENIRINTADIEPLKTKTENNIQSITTLRGEQSQQANRIIALEAKEDLTPRVKNLEGSVKVINAKEDLTPKVLELQQKVANLEQGEDYGIAIQSINSIINRMRDSIESRTNAVDDNLRVLNEYKTSSSTASDALGDRVHTLENLNIGPAIDTLRSRVNSLEAIPNLTSNVGKLESTTNTLTNSVASIKSKVDGLLKAEDPFPRIRTLEDINQYKNNIGTEDKEEVVYGTTMPVYPGVVYNFNLKTEKPKVKIELHDNNTTQEIIMIFDAINIKGNMFMLSVIRPDGVEMKLPKRIISSKNGEPQLVKLMTYDRGITWFYNVSPSLVGKDALIDDDVTTELEAAAANNSGKPKPTN